MSSTATEPTYGPVAYHAERREIHVGVVATGANRTSGYRTSLAFDSTQGGGKTHLVLINIKPSGLAAEVITPFHATFDIFLPESVKTLHIKDSQGEHEVQIQPGEVFMPPRVQVR